MKFEWWGVKLRSDNRINSILKDILDGIQETLENYFSYKTNNIDSFLEETSVLFPSEEKFIEFMKENINRLRLSLSGSFMFSKGTLSSLEYFYYIVQDERSCEYPDDSRDAIITFFIEVPIILLSSTRKME